MAIYNSKPLPVHLIDDNNIFVKDIEQKYPSGKDFSLYIYPSAEKFCALAATDQSCKVGSHVVILAVQLGSPDKDVKKAVIEEINRLIPDVNIINICHPRELGKGVPTLRFDKTIHLVNNENTLIRIDNAVRWVLAGTNLSKQRRRYTITAGIFIASLIITAFALALYYLSGSI